MPADYGSIGEDYDSIREGSPPPYAEHGSRPPSYHTTERTPLSPVPSASRPPSYRTTERTPLFTVPSASRPPSYRTTERTPLFPVPAARRYKPPRDTLNYNRYSSFQSRRLRPRPAVSKWIERVAVLLLGVLLSIAYLVQILLTSVFRLLVFIASDLLMPVFTLLAFIVSQLLAFVFYLVVLCVYMATALLILSIALGLVIGAMYLFISLLVALIPHAYTRRIAVLGATPAGIAAAVQISHAHGLANITLYSGGEELPGATMFNPDSEFLVQAAWGLETLHWGEAGVYDGRSWSFTVAHPNGWIERRWAEFLWWTRFHGEPKLAEKAVDEARKGLLRVGVPFEDVAKVVGVLGAGVDAERWFADRGVGRAFQREVMNGWVRRGTGQNIGGVSGLAAAVEVAGGAGLVEVEGLWEGLVSACGAVVRRGEGVEVERGWWGGGWVVRSWEAGELREELFDDVVVASEWGVTALSPVQPPISGTVMNSTWVEAWTTTFISEHGELSPDAFPGGGRHGAVPEIVLTTPCSWEYTEVSGRSGVQGLGHAPFWALEKGAEVAIPGVGMGWRYTLVSAWEFSETELQQLVRAEVYGVTTVYMPKAFPLLYPRTEFSDVVLDQGLWYAAGMQEVAAGVEVAVIGGVNVAELVVRKWKREGRYVSNKKRIPKVEEEKVVGGKMVQGTCKV